MSTKKKQTASQIARHAVTVRWAKTSERKRKSIGKWLASHRTPEQQSEAARALAKQMTKKQKHERAMKGVEARRRNREQQLKQGSKR